MRRLLSLTCAMVFVDTLFFTALAPLVPYFAEGYGLSKTLAGVLSAAFGAGVLLGSAPSGYFTARLGPRVAAILGLSLMSLSSLLFGLADGAWLLVAFRLSAGFGSALTWVAAFTWLVTRAPDERRGQVIGTLMSAAVAGSLLGPALGGAASAIGILLAFGLAAAAGLAVALFAALTTAPAPSDASLNFSGAFAKVLRPRPATGLLLICFPPLLFGALTVLAPLELDRLGWGSLAVGAVFLATALFEATAHPLLGRWSDRAGYRKPVLAGLAGSLAILIALSLSPTALLVALLVVLAGVAFNAPLVPGTSLFSRAAEKAGVRAAVAFGFTNFAWASGNALGGFLGGSLADLGGDALPYLSLATACLLTLLLLRRIE